MYFPGKEVLAFPSSHNITGKFMARHQGLTQSLREDLSASVVPKLYKAPSWSPLSRFPPDNRAAERREPCSRSPQAAAANAGVGEKNATGDGGSYSSSPWEGTSGFLLVCCASDTVAKGGVCPDECVEVFNCGRGVLRCKIPSPAKQKECQPSAGWSLTPISWSVASRRLLSKEWRRDRKERSTLHWRNLTRSPQPGDQG